MVKEKADQFKIILLGTKVNYYNINKSQQAVEVCWNYFRLITICINFLRLRLNGASVKLAANKCEHLLPKIYLLTVK